MSWTDQLDNWCRPRVPGYLGAFPSDIAVTKTLKPGECMIANYSDSKNNGAEDGHWIAMLRLDNGSGYFFGSYGKQSWEANKLLNTHAEFHKYMAHHFAENWTRNKRDYQALNDDSCGHYAAYCCLTKGPDQNPQAWKMFTGNKKRNDRIIKQLVQLPPRAN